MKIIFFLAAIFFHYSVFANLTQTEAINRRKQVQSVSYNIDLTFKKGIPVFDGVVTLNVELTDVTQPLRVDLRAREIKSVTINGKNLQAFEKGPDSFSIPVKNLHKNMKVTVTYSGFRDQADFLTFIDPTDGSEYFYSHLEPYGAHVIFPCFNQPDIKATYELSVNAPSEWKIIANESSTSIKTVNNVTTHKFSKTPLLSTYLFFVGGGNFVEWKDSHNGLPLYLYARKSLAKNVDVEEVFKVTKKGLDYFSKYFNYLMPFSKYGQVFVPNFVSMGMENPGAVTLNEKNIFTSPPLMAMRIKREDLIMHELAHMWFGDLVTMKWWDDLWLNEAFASYFAGLATKEALGRSTSDLYFQAQKYNSYKEDSFSTTHPVMGEVPDSMSAFATFDAITYSKGASVLKQLHNLVGDKVFREGLEFYFKTYAYKNTLFTDFLQAFEKFHGSSLKDWAHSWLQSKGLNSIAPKISCEQGKVKSFSVLMKPSVDKKFFPHKADFGFYKSGDKNVSLLYKESLYFDKAETSFPQLTGKACPDFVFPNEGDHDYGLYYFDSVSLKHINKALAFHPDSNGRLLLWNMLAFGVRDGSIDINIFLKAAEEAFKFEAEGEVINIITGIQPNIKNASFRDTFNIFASIDDRTKFAPIFESRIYNRLLNLPKDHSFKQDLYVLFSLVAQSKLAQDRIIQYLGKAKAGTSEFNQEMRWRLLTALSRNGHPSAIPMAEAEFKADQTESGERNLIIVKTAFPSLKTREELWNKFLHFDSMNPMTAYDASEFVHTPNRPDLSAPFLQKYFDLLRDMDWIQFNGLTNHYFSRFYPTYVCSPEALKMSQNAFQNAKRLSPKAKSRWIQLEEELALCIQRKSKSSY